MFEALNVNAKAPRVPNQSRAAVNAVLRKTIGQRMVMARELNGIGQSEAALLFGWNNSTQLSLIEMGKRTPPHDKLVLVPKVYAVSVDFIYGLSDEPERDPKLAERQAMLHHVGGMLQTNAERITALILQYLNHGAPSVLATKGLLTKADAVARSVQRFQEANKDQFDELRGGATVLLSCRELIEAVGKARAVIERHERFGELAFKMAEARVGLTHPLLDAANEGVMA